MTEDRPSRSSRRRARDAARRAPADLDALAAAVAHRAAAAAPARGRAPRRLADAQDHRWLPIGPSAVRRGQASGYPYVAGRILDLAVSEDGDRIYALSAGGGLWYSPDAGASWEPVGGWQPAVPVQDGGRSNDLAGGALLVAFGATAADDHVMVGTGEYDSSSRASAGTSEGKGVLVGVGPVEAADPAAVWEADSGASVFTGVSIGRLLRQPGRHPGVVETTDPASPAHGHSPDRVLACATFGLYVGTRVPTGGGQPERYDWQSPAATPPADAPDGFDGFAFADGAWVDTGSADGRLVLCCDGWGPVVSDDAGENLAFVRLGTGLFRGLQGRSALALVPGTTRGYVLGQLRSGETGLWRLDDVTATPVRATRVPGLRDDIFGTRRHNQRDYDIALAAVEVGGTDRVYVGGSGRLLVDSSLLDGAEFVASLWCFQVSPTPALVAVPRVSDTAAGASYAGLVGHDVHADVHVIRVLDHPASGAHPEVHQVWVGCDGGVFASSESGRVETFSARNTGLVTTEPGFLAVHPVSSQLVAAGLQDNGTVVRVGDTVWEEVHLGDGGGVLFHPGHPEVMLDQYVSASWRCDHPRYRDPMQRRARRPGVLENDTEDQRSAFYSGAAAVAGGPHTGRVAIGTYRVWVCDDLTDAATPTWRVLPFTTGTAWRDRRARPSAGADAVMVVAGDRWGQPFDGTPRVYAGSVESLRWADASTLLAVYHEGIARYTDRGGGTWDVEYWPKDGTTGLSDEMTLTDVAPVPGTLDFYVSAFTFRGGTSETLVYFNNLDGEFHATALRSALGGPLDPAYAVVVDPVATANVYVGTVTGVWTATRADRTGGHGGAAGWTRLDNGLPWAAAQDLAVWVDPARVLPGAAGYDAAVDARTSRVLRVAMQSRGLFQLELGPAAPRHTWVRVHDADDRRVSPTPLAHPRQVDAARVPVVLPDLSSPDVVLRPRWPVATAPPFPSLGPGDPPLTAGTILPYDLWTFQTAFRWLHPSVVADGTFSTPFRGVLKAHRGDGRAVIDRPLWEAVVGGTHLGPDGEVLTGAAGAGQPLAVYRPPWHSRAAGDRQPTEAELYLAVPPTQSLVNGVWWTGYREPSSIEILLHHNDSRALPANHAWAMLLWQPIADPFTAGALDVTGVPQFRLDAAGGAAGVTAPGAWHAVPTAAGPLRHLLPVPLSAHLPTAVTVDLDLTSAADPPPLGVVLLALSGSLLDEDLLPDAAAPITLSDLVRTRHWAAAKVVVLGPRPT